MIDQPEVQWTVAGASCLLAVLSVILWWREADPPPPPGTDGPLLRIDINSASEQEISLLPEIGPATARAIIEDRAARGPFVRVDDLGRVRGIGPKTIEAIRPYIQQADAP